MSKKSAISVHLSESEAAQVRRAAAAARMPVSAYLRLLALAGAPPSAQASPTPDMHEVREALLALAAEIRADRRKPYPGEWAVRRNAEGLGAGLDPFTQRIAGVIDWSQVWGAGRWPAADDPGLVLPPATRKDWPATLEQAQALVAEKTKSIQTTANRKE